jgi:diacylglycerol kinase (ATP)
MTLVVKPPTDAGQLEELRAAVAAVRGRGHAVRVRSTFEVGDARRFAHAAALGGCDVVVAVGGDGTLNEVVNGLAAADARPSLAIVPFGTANDFASSFGIPEDAADALILAAEGDTYEVDVARVNRRCFINVSTGGFGADVTRRAGKSMKRWLGRLAYVFSGARRLVEFETGHGEFRADGRSVFEGDFIFFAVGNGWRTGGGARVTPRADAGDGQLDVVVVRGTSRLDLLALLPELRAGSHLDNPDVSYFRARRIEVEAEDRVSVNADGEAVAGTRFRYDLLPRRIPFVIPH